MSKDAMSDHVSTLLALVGHGVFCVECPFPWSAERRENFDGKDNHAWAIRNGDGQVLVYLAEAEVDGEAFVAWANANATKWASTYFTLTRLSVLESNAYVGVSEIVVTDESFERLLEQGEPPTDALVELFVDYGDES